MALIKSQLFSEHAARRVASYVLTQTGDLLPLPLLLLLHKTMIMVMRYHDNSIVHWRVYDAWYV